MRCSLGPCCALVFACSTLILATASGEEKPAPQKAEPAADIGIKAPPGFEVTLFAGDELAHDIFSLTLDSQGRAVVAGRDYIKTLVDDDRDGRADRAVLYSNFPASGAHGMCFVGNDLYVTGDNGVWRLRDDDNDLRADRRAQTS